MVPRRPQPKLRFQNQQLHEQGTRQARLAPAPFLLQGWRRRGQVREQDVVDRRKVFASLPEEAARLPIESDGRTAPKLHDGHVSQTPARSPTAGMSSLAYAPSSASERPVGARAATTDVHTRRAEDDGPCDAYALPRSRSSPPPPSHPLAHCQSATARPFGAERRSAPPSTSDAPILAHRRSGHSPSPRLRAPGATRAGHCPPVLGQSPRRLSPQRTTTRTTMRMRTTVTDRRPRRAPAQCTSRHAPHTSQTFPPVRGRAETPMRISRRTARRIQATQGSKCAATMSTSLLTTLLTRRST